MFHILAAIDYPDNTAVVPFIPLSTDLRSKLSSTIEFVRSFIFLYSTPHENFQNDEEYENRLAIILKSITLLFEYLKSSEGLSLEFEIVKCCIEEVLRLFDSKVNFSEKDLIHQSMLFVENLLIDLYKTTEINMVRAMFLYLFLPYKNEF